MSREHRGVAGLTMRIGPGEFRARPLRVHALLHDVPLEDAWAVPLSGGGAGRTVQDVRAVMLAGRETAPAVVRGLFRLRERVGALLAWTASDLPGGAASFADRLSPADRAQSLVAPGTPDGTFILLYRFEDEQLSELRNATVHAFASLSIRQTPGGYLAYLGVFVQPVHRFTRLYMGAIAPFRRLVVYPAIIRKVQRAWAERYGGESGVETVDGVAGATARRRFRLVPRRRLHQNDAKGGLHGRVYSQPPGLGA